jgi:hypothetical protein
MQISNLESRHQECQVLEPVLKRVSVSQVVDHFQRALFNVELSGSGTGAVIISSLLMLISLCHQAAQCGAQKGVI